MAGATRARREVSLTPAESSLRRAVARTAVARSPLRCRPLRGPHLYTIHTGTLNITVGLVTVQVVLSAPHSGLLVGHVAGYGLVTTQMRGDDIKGIIKTGRENHTILKCP